MRAPVARRVTGTGLALVGLAFSYNLFAPPGYRIWGHAVDRGMWFGPVLFVTGLLVIRSSRPDSPSAYSEARPPYRGTLNLGLMLLSIPALLFAYAILMDSELAGGLFTLAVFVNGLPGLVLVAVGAYRGWRARRILG